MRICDRGARIYMQSLELQMKPNIQFGYPQFCLQRSFSTKSNQILYKCSYAARYHCLIWADNAVSLRICQAGAVLLRSHRLFDLKIQHC